MIAPDWCLRALSQALPGQTTPEGVPSFKLVLVGDGGTGENANREPLLLRLISAAKLVTASIPHLPLHAETCLLL